MGRMVFVSVRTSVYYPTSWFCELYTYTYFPRETGEYSVICFNPPTGRGLDPGLAGEIGGGFVAAFQQPARLPV